MFTDYIKINVKAGDGGNGAISFHREKYVAAGGPDGGDGGRGGDIIFRVDDNLSTLVDFRYNKKYIAKNGENGGQKNCSGKSSDPIIVTVPRGTIIRDSATELIIKDMSFDEDFVVCKGGKGGWGNSHFATPTRQVPRFAKNGIPGEEREIILELKLLADVGLLGYPNVGKSTLLSVVSAAKPKIANYHFTTIQPNLGVVRVEEGKSFVMADIPGLIEGASEGIGLGHYFLRHIERCRLLVHIVDISGSEARNPIEDFEKINAELLKYSPQLALRPQIVVANKIDMIFDKELAEQFENYIKEKGLELFKISALTQQGLRELLFNIYDRLQALPPIEIYESQPIPVEMIVEGKDKSFEVTVHEGVYIVEGAWLINVLGSINFEDYESLQYLQRVLRKNGVFDKLVDMGIQDGDTVSIYDVEFDYVP